MRILGIDPGLSDTGWAVLEAQDGARARLKSSGVIRSSPRAGLAERLRDIHGRVAELLRENLPAFLAIEEMFFLKAAHSIRATLQARGVILLAAAQAEVPVREYNPRQVKIALTGSGAAAKPQMQRMMQALLGLPEPLHPDHAADAAAIALCQLRCERGRRLVVLDRIGGRERR